jgi:hypothetical protein
MTNAFIYAFSAAAFSAIGMVATYLESTIYSHNSPGLGALAGGVIGLLVAYGAVAIDKKK